MNSSPELRIAAPRGSTGSDGWAKEGSPGQNANPLAGSAAENRGAILRPPEPGTEANPRGQLTATSNPGSAHDSRGTSFEEALRQIAARKPLWQDLKSVGENGDWQFSCSIPNSQNARIRRTYEAKAGDPTAAIRAVLEQLEKEQ
jgi:hypothetical protein